MNNLSGSGVTNSLLALIAVLLLVMVVQNSQQRPNLSFGNAPMSGRMSGMDNPHTHPPMDNNPHAFSDSAPQEFDPSQMIYAALRCPNDTTLTLGDPGCQGKDAAARKKAVDEAFNQGLPIPKVFDQIITKFGEKALTEQALEIRKSRRG